MPEIKKAVGRGAIAPNMDDVKLVQQLLNQHRVPPFRLLSENGVMDDNTIAAIEEFQTRVVKMIRPDGRVDPGGKTWLALSGASAAAAPKNLSGAAWWHANEASFPNSTSVDDLETGFKTKVKDFIAALETAGASVVISSTKRHKKRAYLMHYSWKIAKGMIKASAVPAEVGVDITWDHGNTSASKKAAQEMVKLFDMAHIAALASRHINGTAIDMTITWTGTLKIKNKAGKEIEIGPPRNGAESTKLHAVGSSYGVKKLVTDPPHWSSDGQ